MSIDTGTDTDNTTGGGATTAATASRGESRQWTARMRRAAETAFPPDRLLPDRQPAYMASWIYVFGVLTVVSLAWVIITGCILAIMGPTWWHVSSTGLFVNSLHLWSVEAFFFFMVIHLWGKFFMAAWRGKRRLTWATGVISFLVSVAAAFTGYLSQTNFDSQWISTQAKDGINSTGAGAVFNVLNFGQMLMWHIVLLPIGVVVIAGLHVLLVRRRGIVPPFADEAREEDVTAARCPTRPRPRMSAARRKARRFNPDRDVNEWKGAYVPYDILKEAFVAFLAVAALIVLLAVVFSSPDDKAVTLKRWSLANPVDFAQTAITELDGTSATASYGPPYNSTPDAAQHIGFFEPAQWFGVHQPIDTAQDFVLSPLKTLVNQPVTRAALDMYENASPSQQNAWTTEYEKAVANATDVDGRLHVPAGGYGPVGVMIGTLTSMAQDGGLDGTLLSEAGFYNTNYTKPLLFIADGTYLADLAGAQHLQGNQWGMMNETGNYPGQAWLWLYTMWYQVAPMNTSTNGDLEVWSIMMVLSLVLILLPFIPILRSIPRWTRVYRLIWRRHYRELAAAA